MDTAGATSFIVWLRNESFIARYGEYLIPFLLYVIVQFVWTKLLSSKASAPNQTKRQFQGEITDIFSLSLFAFLYCFSFDRRNTFFNSLRLYAMCVCISLNFVCVVRVRACVPNFSFALQMQSKQMSWSKKMLKEMEKMTMAKVMTLFRRICMKSVMYRMADCAFDWMTPVIHFTIWWMTDAAFGHLIKIVRLLGPSLKNVFLPQVIYLSYPANPCRAFNQLTCDHTRRYIAKWCTHGTMDILSDRKCRNEMANSRHYWTRRIHQLCTANVPTVDSRFAAIENESYQRVLDWCTVFDIGLQANLRYLSVIRLIEISQFNWTSFPFPFLQAFVPMARSNNIITMKYQHQSQSEFWFVPSKVSD